MSPASFVAQHKAECRRRYRASVALYRIRTGGRGTPSGSETSSVAMWRRKGLSPRDATLLVLQTRAAEAVR